MERVSTNPVQISVVVPTRDEAENLPVLLPRIDAALGGRDYEVIVVDDASTDGTPAVCRGLAQRYPLRLMVRAKPKDGLSGAVLHGAAEARGEYVVVMDADLQHPPEQIRDLLAPLERDESDFVIGSRYAPGGSAPSERWPLARRLNSLGATILARPFAGETRDPMSGFFALRNRTLRGARHLSPLGYKIGLELMCKCRARRIREVPIRFGVRTAGKSKLTFRERTRYLEHLSRLYDFAFPKASPLIKFLITGGASLFCAICLWSAVRLAPLPPATAIFVAWSAAVLMTATFHLRYVRTDRQFVRRPRPWADFCFLSIVEWAACTAAAVAALRHTGGDAGPSPALFAFGCAAMARYVLRKELLHDLRGLRFRSRAEEAARAARAAAAETALLPRLLPEQLA